VSWENVEIIRCNMAASKRGDWDAAAATYDPNILVRADPRWPESCIFGRDSVVRWFQGLIETAGSEVREEEIVDLGDRVLLRQRWTMRGQHSGVQGEQQVSGITTFRQGRIILIEYFLNHDEALKAVGLSE
jgi:ketosteroid isomerase-like protein